MIGVALDRYLPGRNAMLANELMYGDSIVKNRKNEVWGYII